jgi:hypothetical protein
MSDYFQRGSKYVEVGKVYKNSQGCFFKVLEYRNSCEILIEFQDENKYKLICDAKGVKTGGVKNPFNPVVCGVGYFGVGPYVCTIRGDDGVKKNSEAYEVWRGIMRRCYDAQHQTKSALTYAGCSVNPIWHNFQNFAHWFYNNEFYQQGWHLDKDIIVRDNKEYGPLRCAFVPPDVNVATTTTKAKRGLYPIGVYKRKKTGKFVAQLGKGGNNQIRLIETPDLLLATAAYKAAKERYMVELGEMWEGKLDPRVITSLKSWVVRETD